MLQVLPKWKVQWENPDGGVCTMYMSDNFMGNILRRVSDIHFSPSGIENEPISIKIERVN